MPIWPLVVLKLIGKNIALYKLSQRHPSHDKYRKILLEKIAAYEIILEFNNILD